MTNSFKLACGCIVTLQGIELEPESATCEFRVDFCDKHNDLKVFYGPNKMIVEPGVLEEESAANG